MMRFKLQGMTYEDYGNYMLGSNSYSIKEIWVKAENKEDAYKIATKQYPHLQINTYIESEEEIQKEEEKRKLAREEQERKEKEKEEKKLAKEQAKAQEMGLTLEDYNEYKRLERNMKRHASQMRRCYEEIEFLKEDIKEEEKIIKYYEEKMKKFQVRG